jgi:lysophospholipase L1-like esterase
MQSSGTQGILLFALLTIACDSQSSDPGKLKTGTGTAGASATTNLPATSGQGGGMAGPVLLGGVGSSTLAPGGAISTGGVVSTGGAVLTGGTASTGGAISMGEAISTGGKPTTGDAASTGGAVSTGDAGSTGGAVSTGDAAATGEVGPTTQPACNSQPLPKMTIYMIGDSTMVSSRWGGQLQSLFPKDMVTVSNHAQAGRSSKSFISEGLWAKVEKQIQTNDWLIIQFGHNDEKEDAERHTDAFTTFPANLKMFAQAALNKGAHPIICTPIVRLNLTSHGDYPDGAIQGAKEIAVPLVDIHAITKDYVSKMANPKSFYSDSSHPTTESSKLIAKMFVTDIQKQGLPLACYVR